MSTALDENIARINQKNKNDVASLIKPAENGHVDVYAGLLKTTQISAQYITVGIMQWSR